MNRLFALVAVALFAVGCAEEGGPETESVEDAAGVPAAAPEADAKIDEAGQASEQAKPICIDWPWGGTTCCTPTSCVDF
jgi:hypothetical protein